MSATPITPKVLCDSIIWHYFKPEDTYVVSMNGEEIFHTKLMRDAQLFMAELKAFVLLWGSRVETTPSASKPESKVRILSESDMNPTCIEWYVASEFAGCKEIVLPPMGVRVLVKSNSGQKAIATRVSTDGGWAWEEHGDIFAVPSEVEFWAPIPN